MPSSRGGTTLVVSIGDGRGGIGKFAERAAAGMATHGTVRLCRSDLDADTFSGVIRQVCQLRASATGCRTIVLQASPYHWSRGSALCGLFQAFLIHVVFFRRIVLIMHDTPSGRLRRPTLYPRLIVLMHWVVARKLVFLSQAERTQAGLAGKGRRVYVVPLYIENRSVARATAPMNPSALRLGVVGFIDSRKDPLFLLEVVQRIQGVHLTFLGGALPGEEGLTRRLQAKIRTLGLETQVKITGYLSECDMDRELARINIGLCLYRQAATSASLSTLLAARRPIVASNLPIFREYAATAPLAISIVDMDPDEVTRAILAMARRPSDWCQDIEKLSESRSLSNFGKALWKVVDSAA